MTIIYFSCCCCNLKVDEKAYNIALCVIKLTICNWNCAYSILSPSSLSHVRATKNSNRLVHFISQLKAVTRAAKAFLYIYMLALHNKQKRISQSANNVCRSASRICYTVHISKYRGVFNKCLLQIKIKKIKSSRKYKKKKQLPNFKGQNFFIVAKMFWHIPIYFPMLWFCTNLK